MYIFASFPCEKFATRALKVSKNGAIKILRQLKLTFCYSMRDYQTVYGMGSF